MQSKTKIFILLSIFLGIVLLGFWFSFIRKLIFKTNTKDVSFQANIHNKKAISLRIEKEDLKNSSKDVSIKKNIKTKTGNIKTIIYKKNNNKIPPSNKEIQPRTLTLLAPPFINAQAFHELRKEIYKKNKIRINITIAKNELDYKQKLLFQKKNPEIDIILLSTEYYKSFENRGLNMSPQSPLIGIFHPLFHPFLKNKKTTYIPFALDPLILLHQKDIFSIKTPMTLKILQKKLLNTSKNSISFGFDFYQKNIQDLENYNFLYTEYIGFLSLILDQSKKQRTTYLIDYFMKSPVIDRNLRKKLIKQAENKKCNSSQRLCLLKINKLQATPAWLSDISQTENLFQYNLEKNYIINNFPLNEKQYPAKGRGFIINKNSFNLDNAKIRTTGYIKYAEENDGSLWSSEFSAFNTHIQRQKIEQRLKPLKKVFQKFYLINGFLNQEKTLIDQSNFIPMLKGKYNKVIFLKEEIEKDI